MRVRKCTENDAEAVRKFVSENKPLGVHTSYTYWLLFRYFGDGCFVIEKGSRIIGYASGMKSTYLVDPQGFSPE